MKGRLKLSAKFTLWLSLVLSGGIIVSVFIPGLMSGACAISAGENEILNPSMIQTLKRGMMMVKQFLFRAVVSLGITLGAFGFMLIRPEIVFAEGPIANWQLDETSGPPYDDPYGNHDGACSPGCPTATSGKISGGQAFTASPPTGITVPAHADFHWNIDASFSIEVWLKGIPGQTCSNLVIPEVAIGRLTNPLLLRGWGLGCSPGAGTASFFLSDTSGISTTLISTKAITDGAWHHVVGVRDRTANLNRLYVDGAEVISASITYATDFDFSATPINIGSLGIGGYFQGTLDEIAIYNEVLSLAEIRSRYYLAHGYANMCTTPVRIMPLGDSITKGTSSGVVDEDKKIGYRKYL